MSTLPMQELVDEMVVQIVEAAEARNDLTILTAFMAGDDYSDGSNYSAGDIAYAVAKPWKFADVLAEAKAALEASS